MNIETKAEQLIIRLMRETYEGSVHWRNEKPPTCLTAGTNDFYPLFLSTRYKGINIGLYQRRYQYFFDERESCWCEGLGLCVYQAFVGGISSVVWKYEERSSSLTNLFAAATEQASGIDTILDDLLS
ncbi:hypothetical protein [Stutzerimonas xanthomarina]|uniref:hypothetical protein n=1 Tax=Stutzerimonas xanthomarina TaxID=271420 RepID=UPI003AA7BA73